MLFPWKHDHAASMIIITPDLRTPRCFGASWAGAATSQSAKRRNRRSTLCGSPSHRGQDYSVSIVESIRGATQNALRSRPRANQPMRTHATPRRVPTSRSVVSDASLGPQRLPLRHDKCSPAHGPIGLRSGHQPWTVQIRDGRRVPGHPRPCMAASERASPKASNERPGAARPVLSAGGLQWGGGIIRSRHGV